MTQPIVFADTSYYLALISPRDALHAQSLVASRRMSADVVTSAWVIQELADGLSSPPARAGFLLLYDALLGDARVTIVEPQTSRFGEERLLCIARGRTRRGLSRTALRSSSCRNVE